MRRRQALALQPPFVGRNPHRIGAGPEPKFIAVLASGDDFLCIEYQLGISSVVMFAASKDEFDTQRYTKLEEPVQPYATELKNMAIKSHATREAIVLLKAILPLTKEESDTMASTKLSKKEADAEGLATAAKKQAVGGKPAAVKAAKGEALAQARAVKAAKEAVNRTYKVLKKTNEGRDGSWTQAMIGHALANTDTDGAKADLTKDKEFGEKRMDFKWLSDKGYIQFK